MALATTGELRASRGGHALAERLTTRGWEFDFYQAIWLLERYGDSQAWIADRGPVAEESFRFRPEVSLGFPATDVRRINHCTETASGTPYFQVDVTFMGLYGASTPLPLHYAVDVLRSVVRTGASPAERPGLISPVDELHDTDESARSSQRDFLDVFNHRLISLFYRSGCKYRYDRTFGMPHRDSITDYLLQFIGCRSGYDEDALGVHPVRLLRYAGFLTEHPRSAVALEGMLFDWWENVPIRVQQCVGRWVSVAPVDQTSLGITHGRLGEDVTVGEQVYDLNGEFRVELGPMDWTTYESFLPGEQRFRETRALVQLYSVDPLSFNLELRLQAREVAELILSSSDRAGRLGFTSWIRTFEIEETSVTFEAF